MSYYFPASPQCHASWMACSALLMSWHYLTGDWHGGIGLGVTGSCQIGVAAKQESTNTYIISVTFSIWKKHILWPWIPSPPPPPHPHPKHTCTFHMLVILMKKSTTPKAWFTLASDRDGSGDEDRSTKAHTKPVKQRQNKSKQTLPFSYVLSPFYRVCREFYASVSVSASIYAASVNHEALIE